MPSVVLLRAQRKGVATAQNEGKAGLMGVRDTAGISDRDISRTAINQGRVTVNAATVVRLGASSAMYSARTYAAMTIQIYP